MSEPMTDLDQMLACLDVEVRPEPYVFVCADVPGAEAAARIEETEGTTLVLTSTEAERLGLATSPSFAWLTLTINSSLTAVGLTAAFSTALAAEQISCNVLAGYHHDHLLVSWEDADRAVAVLRSLRDRHDRGRRDR